MKHIRWMLACLVLLCLTGCGKSEETKERQLALREQGMQQALEGDYEGALASYEEALRLANYRAGALELDIAAYKASALYHAGELQKAIDTFTAVLDLKESAEIYMARGMLYREAENAAAANEDFKKAIELTPKKDKLMLGRLGRCGQKRRPGGGLLGGGAVLADGKYGLCHKYVSELSRRKGSGTSGGLCKGGRLAD